MAGGGTTNLGRASGEQVVAAAFMARGMNLFGWDEWRRLALKDEAPAGVVLVKGYPFTTIYQTQGNVDFVVMEDRLPRTTIEVKHQGVSGSCDEKMPYVVHCALTQWPTDHGILVLSGEHWASPRGLAAARAMRQLSGQLAGPGKRFEIMAMTEATNWIARNF